MLTGAYRDVQSAFLAVKGEETDALREENARLRKESEEMERDRQARAKVKTSAGPAPVMTPPETNVVRLSEHEAELERLIASGKKQEALKLIRDADSGRRRLVSG
jgi:hypothetical protein